MKKRRMAKTIKHQCTCCGKKKSVNLRAMRSRCKCGNVDTFYNWDLVSDVHVDPKTNMIHYTLGCPSPWSVKSGRGYLKPIKYKIHPAVMLPMLVGESLWTEESERIKVKFQYGD